MKNYESITIWVPRSRGDLMELVVVVSGTCPQLVGLAATVGVAAVKAMGIADHCQIEIRMTAPDVA